MKEYMRKYLYHLIAMFLFLGLLWLSFSITSMFCVALSSVGVVISVVCLEYYKRKIGLW